MSWFEKLMPKESGLTQLRIKKLFLKEFGRSAQVVIQFYTEKILFKINLFVRIVAII